MEKRNKYVGLRYVPKIMGEWDNTKEYEPLMIVTHDGNSYTSKTFIPVGIDITNESFWCLTGNYNAQIIQLQNDFKNQSDNILSTFNTANETNKEMFNENTTKLFNEVTTFENKFKKFIPNFACYMDTFPNGKRIISTDEVKNKLDKFKKCNLKEWIIEPKIVFDSTNNTVKCDYDLNEIKKQIQYGNSIGIKPICLKMPMLFIEKETIMQIGIEKFKADYKKLVLNIATSLQNCAIKYAVVFNENEWLYLDKQYEDFVIDVIESVKALGYKVCINTMGVINTLKLSDRIKNAVDVFSANTYPNISNKLDKTTFDDVVNSLNTNNIINMFKHLKNTYNKKMIISETGVMDYWACLNNPGQWQWDSKLQVSSNGRVEELLLYGIFNSIYNSDLFEEVWWCYDTLTQYEQTVKLLNNYL